MSQYRGIQFGSGNPATNTGLSPTFIMFAKLDTGTTTLPPGITETIVGSGLYYFIYGATGPISFTVDGGSALATADRYVSGTMDPVQSVDVRLGYTSDSFGSTLTDPATAISYLKRTLEFLEGNANYDKATAIWSVYSRGSSTLLRVKTLSNTSSDADKT